MTPHKKPRKKEKTVIGWAVYGTRFMSIFDDGEKYEMLQVFALGETPYRIFPTKQQAQNWKTDSSDIIHKVRIIPFDN